MKLWSYTIVLGTSDLRTLQIIAKSIASGEGDDLSCLSALTPEDKAQLWAVLPDGVKSALIDLSKNSVPAETIAPVLECDGFKLGDRVKAWNDCLHEWLDGVIDRISPNHYGGRKNVFFVKAGDIYQINWLEDLQKIEG